MGGSRVPALRRHFNIFVVFLVSGLWHGANWTYIIWGSLHGIYMVFGAMTAHIRNKIRDVIGLAKVHWLDNGVQKLITFFLVTIAWIFFRANTVPDAFYMIRKLPSALGEFIGVLKHTFTLAMPIANARVLMCVAVVLIMELIHSIQKKRSLNTLLQNQPRYIRWCVYYVFVFAVIYLGIFHNRQFIYFQF